MVKHILVTLFVVQAFFAAGQNLDLIQKLKTRLDHAEDHARFTTLTDLAWEYRWAYPDSTIYYAAQAFDLGERLELPAKLAKPLNFIGIAFNYKGNRLKAYEYYDKALQQSIRQLDSIQIAYSNNNLGRLFFEQGILSRSYEYFTQALIIFKTLNDPSGLAYTYQSLANLYMVQGDFQTAEKNYRKAYQIRLTLGNTRNIMSALTQLGKLHQDNHEHDKALYYFNLADSAGNVIRDEINLAEIKTLIADSYLNQDKLAEAEAICTAGLTVITRVNNIRMLPQAYLTMGQIRFRKNDLAGSRKYIDQALAISNKIKDLNSKMESHFWLWKLSTKENNTTETLRNHNLYLILKDSVKDLDVIRETGRLQFEIEIARKEKENELLKATQAKNAAVIEHQKLQNILLTGVIVFGSLLIFVQWRSNKKHNAINKKLEQQNKFIEQQREEIIRQNENLSRRNRELDDLNHEQDTLMSIVAHDLKSPLNRIRGMMEIIKLEGGLTKDQQTYLAMTQEATHAGLDLIKDLLDVHMLQEHIVPTHSTFDLSAFILEKTSAFEPSAEAKDIHLQITRVHSEEVYLDPNYVSRIVDNLLSNAIKFSGKNTVVKIGAGKENDHLWISVEDEGPGFSEADREQLFQRFKTLSARPTAGETSNGLGLAIVKTLVDRLGGSIDLSSQPNKGSKFTVRLPLLVNEFAINGSYLRESYQALQQ